MSLADTKINVLASSDPYDALLSWIIASNIPFHATSLPEFKAFWKIVASRGSKLPPPNRQELAGNRLDSFFGKVSQHITKQLAEFSYLALSTDGWTGLSASFWSVTVFGLDDLFRPQVFRLGCIPIYAPVHDNLTLAKKLQEQLLLFGVEPSKISAVMTDEGGASPLIASNFPSASEIRCVAHLMNTILKRAFKDIRVTYPFVSVALSTCEALAATANRSTLDRERLPSNQLESGEAPLTLKQSVDTRWTSILANLKSVAGAQQVIRDFCWGHDNANAAYAQTVRYKDADFWALLDCLIVLLLHFEIAAIEASREGHITAPFCVEAYLCLKHLMSAPQLEDELRSNLEARHLQVHIDRAVETALGCAQIIKRELKAKFVPFTPAELLAFTLYPKNHVVVEATDPKFASSKSKIIEKGLQLLSTKLEEASAKREATIEPPTSIPPAANPYLALMRVGFVPAAQIKLPHVVELESFKVAVSQKMHQTLSVWWQTHQAHFPLIANLARRYLTFPASQVASEQDFSQMGLLATHLTQALLPEKATELGFLASYLRSVRRRSEANIAADAARNRDVTRVNGVKRRLAEITPDPDVSRDVTSSALLALYVPEDLDNGERTSDSEYNVSEALSRDLGGVKKAKHLEDTATRSAPRLTRSRARKVPMCHVNRVRGYSYEVSFNHIPPEAILSEANLSILFGHKAWMVSDWAHVTGGMNESASLRWYHFEASNKARAECKSGRELLTHFGQTHQFDAEQIAKLTQ